jgi:hypothetical protein
MPHELLPKPFTMERLLTSVEAAAGSLSDAVATARPIPGRASGEHGGAGQPPLLLTFAARSAISRRRGRIVVRTRPGGIVTLTLRDEAGHELWRPELSSAQMADELGYCRWRWIHRPRGGELTVEAHAEWQGQHATVARTFALGQPLRGGR